MNFRQLFQSKSTKIKHFLEKNPIIIDVRNPVELLDSSISLALNIPMDNLFSELKKLDKNSDYLIFCRSGNRSRHAKDLMKRNGFISVFDAGSIHDVKKWIH